MGVLTPRRIFLLPSKELAFEGFASDFIGILERVGRGLFEN